MNAFQKGAATAIADRAREISMPFKWLGVFVSGILLLSCGVSREEIERKEKAAASMAVVSETVKEYAKTIATDTINGITHNFIRQASVKCKVENVLNSSQAIEDAIAFYGGYITKSDLNSEVQYTNSIPVSEDSLRETTYYTTVNTISARVPNNNLDSVMRKTIGLATFVDFQKTSADDVKFKLYANQLAERRLAKHQQKVQAKVDKSTSGIQKISEAENDLLDKQELADSKRLESVELIDKVNYSTIIIDLYQPQSEKTRLLLKPNVIVPYEPSFAQKLGKALLSGFGILKSFVLFLAESWSIWLIIIALFFGIKKLVTYFSGKEKQLA